MCFAPLPRAIFEHRNFQNGSDNEVFCAFSLANVLRATAACHFLNIRTSKMTPTNEVFCAFSLANVLRATAACHFWTSATSKMAPRMWCFVHFDLQMCFAPQPRAIFEHRNFQNRLRDCGVLRILTCKCASRLSGVPFFTCLPEQLPPPPAALARLLFEHQEPRIIEKTQRFATSLTFFTRVPSF